MERHYPDILLAGYALDVDLVAADLSSYPGRVHRVYEEAASDERTSERIGTWTKAIVGYVFSRDTGYSSQLKSLFTYLQYRLRASMQVAILLKGVSPQDMIFPEFESTPRIMVDALGEYLAARSVDPKSMSTDPEVQK